MDPLLHEELRKRKRRKKPCRKGYIWLILIFLLALGVIAVFLYSPLIMVQKINVIEVSAAGDETDELPMNPLDQKAKDEFYGNLAGFLSSSSRFFDLFGDKTLLGWFFAEADSKFIRDKATFASGIEIKRNYLRREISVIIDRREPVGIWCLKSLETQGKSATISVSSTPSVFPLRESAPVARDCLWIDKGGYQGEEASLSEGNLVVNVADYSGRKLDQEESVLAPNLFSNFLKIVKFLRSENLNIRSFILKDISHEEIETNPEISAMPRFIFNLRIDPSFASPAIEEVKKIGLEKIDYVDLRIENRAYYKLKE